jgi:PHS family inorganic phosphate transporter-like MFS transporter
MLAYIYWGDADTGSYELIINVLTLAGSVIGQLLFGFLADKFGRKKLYGLELVVVLFGTIGIVQCSAGYNNQSMSILASICFWRTIIGVGIGAEHPISATIAAEYASCAVVTPPGHF